MHAVHDHIGCDCLNLLKYNMLGGVESQYTIVHTLDHAILQSPLTNIVMGKSHDTD